MLTLKRFKALTDAYGADFRHWPDEERAQGEALLLASAPARAVFTAAQTLDDTIRWVNAENDALLFAPGEQAAALARLRSGIAARIAPALPGRQTQGRLFSAWRPAGGQYLAAGSGLAWAGTAVGSGLVLVAGLWLGSTHGAAGAIDLMTALQPRPLAFLGW